MKHINIPIFIPHLGCPNNCVFCNQRSISGKQSFRREIVAEEIETALSTVGDDAETEIAFFGGSFTGIERELMIYLLDTAQRYIDDGRVKSIRLSTRPDYISDEILLLLSEYGVKTVELGLQSMDDGVLKASKRGHNALCGEEACRLVKKYGFDLVGQMMVGLPESTPEKEIYTAKKLCELGVDAVRVYPTVVFFDTELCEMAKNSRYQPIDNDAAVMRTKELLKIFDEYGIECIRVGLCASENLSSAEAVYAGANHSAIGELAMGEVFFDKMCDAIEKNGKITNENILFYVPCGAMSKAIGQKRKNIERICEKYSPLSVKVIEKKELLGYNIIIDVVKNSKGGNPIVS